MRLTDGTQLSVVTGIDDHSRFCVIAKVVARATARPVCDALLEGLSRHGVPEQILTDIQTRSVPSRCLDRPAGGLRIGGTGTRPLPLLHRPERLRLLAS